MDNDLEKIKSALKAARKISFAKMVPVGFQKKRIVALAGVVSVMVEIFMAFCLEFWQKS